MLKDIYTIQHSELLSYFEAEKTKYMLPAHVLGDLCPIIFDRIGKKAVLGFDIYRYSKFALRNQVVVPIALNHLLLETITECLDYEPHIFADYSKPEQFLQRYIDNGDGGFLIFDCPLPALIFAIYFESKLREFNSGNLVRPLRTATDAPVTVRYALAYDDVYRIQFDDKRFNHYGNGIINCARIMAKDRLNRFLIDEHCHDWFMTNLNGIETLRLIAAKDLHIHNYYTRSKDDVESYCLPAQRTRAKPGIDRVDVLKLGDSKSKDTELSLYCIHLQFAYIRKEDLESEESLEQPFSVTVGNLNPEGISL